MAGPILDREVGDLIPTDDLGQRLPLSTDLGRGFLYARYDADLTSKGLTALACGDLDASTVSKLDSVDHMDELERVGRAVAQQISVDDFGPFLSP